MENAGPTAAPCGRGGFFETLNDAVGRVTGVRVRETVPDTFLDRADEVVNVDVSVEELRVRADRPADGLIAFAQREGITHVIFGQSARTRWEILLEGSTLNRFWEEVRDAAIQVVPLGETNA